MNALKRTFMVAAAGVTALAGISVATPAEAQFAALTQARISALTPRCREFPDAPIIGRVAAYYSGDARSVQLNFVGCFYSFAECNSWRKEAMRPLNPPVVHNRCEERF
ncbi:MAG: hypothetical protein AAGB11_15180 [Pseudomonadota bacterium]